MIVLLSAVLGSTVALADPLGGGMREQRVAAVAFRLGRAALPWCDRPVALAGWHLRYIDDYDAALRPDVAAVFAMDRGPNLLAIAADTPAERAQVRPGDTLLAVGDRPLPPTRGAGEDFIAALPTAPTTLEVWRAGATVKLALAPLPGCSATVKLVPLATRNAFADGSAVIASTGIVDLAHDDAELAALLAHELAHNYLHHGVASDADAPPPVIRSEEDAADRFGLVLMAAAGFDLDAAPRFWARLLRDTRRITRGYADHAPRRERLRAMRNEIGRLRRAPRPSWNGIAAPGD